MDVSGRITELRKQYCLSQYALGKKTGIAQAALSQYESGKKTPGIDTIQQLCEGFGITLSDFFQESQTCNTTVDKISGLTTDENLLIQIFRKLSSTYQQDVIAAITCIVDRHRN